MHNPITLENVQISDCPLDVVRRAVIAYVVSGCTKLLVAEILNERKSN